MIILSFIQNKTSIAVKAITFTRCSDALKKYTVKTCTFRPFKNENILCTFEDWWLKIWVCDLFFSFIIFSTLPLQQHTYCTLSGLRRISPFFDRPFCTVDLRYYHRKRYSIQFCFTKPRSPEFYNDTNVTSSWPRSHLLRGSAAGIPFPLI